MIARAFASLPIALLASCSNENLDRAKAASERLDATRNQDTADRIRAVEALLQLSLESDEMTWWRPIQDKGLRDPTPEVRTAAVLALATLCEKRPAQVVKRTFFGGVGYLDVATLQAMGTTDPSPSVRISVARLWGRANVISRHALEQLEGMLGTEQEPEAVTAIVEELRNRIHFARQHREADESKLGKLEESLRR